MAGAEAAAETTWSGALVGELHTALERASQLIRDLKQTDELLRRKMAREEADSTR